VSPVAEEDYVLDNDANDADDEDEDKEPRPQKKRRIWDDSFTLSSEEGPHLRWFILVEERIVFIYLFTLR